jgi:uncharacterized protein involved in exopolysaccharide biosynthesis
MRGGQQSETTVRDICRTVFRHKGKICSCFVVVMTAVVVWTLVTPKAYESQSKLLVRLGRESTTLEPTFTLGREQYVSMPLVSQETEINSIVEVLGSRSLIERVVDELSPEAILGPDDQGQGSASAERPGGRFAGAARAAAAWCGQCATWLSRLDGSGELDDREGAILALQKRIEVLPVRKSNVIQVSYRARSPQRAQAVVAKLTEYLLEEHVRLNRTTGAHEFLADQVGHLREELGRAEQQLLAAERETGVVAPEAQRLILVERVGGLEEELFATEAHLAGSAAAVGVLHTQMARLPETLETNRTTGFGNEGTDAIRARFYALLLEQAEARAKYRDAHPIMKQIGQQVAEAREQLGLEEPTRTQITTARSRVHEEAQLELVRQEPTLDSLRARAEVLGMQLAAARGELVRFNAGGLRVAELRREVELREAEYQKCSASLEEARLDQALASEHISSISVAQPASFSPKPVSPRVALNCLLGLAVGLLGGLVWAFSAEYLDRSFVTPEDIESELGVPALAAIPRLRRRKLAVNGRD